MHLRLASYNIHKCLGLDRRRRPDRIVAVLAALQADVITLQEVDHRLGPRPTTLPRGLLEHATGLTVLPFPLKPLSLGWHGQTILARPDLELVDLRRIDLPGLEPRGALMAEFLKEGTGFRVVGLHLGLLRRYRRMQLDAIRAALSHRSPLPTVLLGDFNEWSPRGGTEALGSVFHTHSPGPSFPAARPVARLDRISVGPGAHLGHSGVYIEGKARFASDHLPIWADVRFDRPFRPEL